VNEQNNKHTASKTELIENEMTNNKLRFKLNEKQIDKHQEED
jgi:hypothetical protein